MTIRGADKFVLATRELAGTEVESRSRPVVSVIRCHTTL
jgi:hypothetical protein